MELEEGSWRVRPYWTLRYTEPLRIDRAEAVLELRAELGKALAKRIEPGLTAIFLSGGLDSTALAGVAKGVVGETLRAYSGVFPAHEQTDESRLLDELTRSLGLPWTQAVARRASVLRNSLAYLREWQVPSIVPNLYFLLPLLRSAADDGVAVMLDGEGGDELFGCVAYAAADRLRAGHPLAAMRLVRGLPWDGAAQPWRATYHLLRRFGVRGALPYAAHHLRQREGVGAPWLSDASRAVLAAERDLWAWKLSDGPRWWAYLSDLVTGGRIRYGLHDTMRRLAEMTGVERRHPMLDDLDLIELILTIPPQLSFDVRHTRPLLRDAVEGLVPDSVRLRTQKADFRFQIEESFAGPERDVIASLVLAPDARIRPFVSQQVAADAVEKVGHPKFIPYQGGLLRMVTAECWLRTLEDPQFPDRLLERGLPAEDVELVPPRGQRSTRRG